MVGDLHDSLACCGLGTVPAAAGGDGYGRLVVDHTRRAAVQGVTRCGSVWSCPVCAPRVASARANAMLPQVKTFMQRGDSAHLLTLTVRHDRTHTLPEILAILSKAWKRVTSGAAWDRKRARGSMQYVRGYDLTWSPRHGWHPHLHLSLYLDEGFGDGTQMSKWFLDRWISVLGRLGWLALLEGQDAQACRDPVKAARYAVTPAAVYEPLAMALKRNRGVGSGITPFEILARAVQGDSSPPLPFPLSKERAIALWREYVEGTKGRRQVTTSRGIVLAEPEQLLLDEDVADEPDHIALLGPSSLRELDRRRLLAPLLDGVEDGAATDRWASRRGAWQILHLLHADDWRIVCVGDQPLGRRPKDPDSPPPD